MAITYEDMTPIIPNTTMKKKFRDGVFRVYVIAPIENYVLHDNAADAFDDDGNTIYRYSVGDCTAGYNYDFSTREMQVPDASGNLITVTAYGSREFFALPASSVPENEIYGGDNDHEVM